MMKSKYVVVYLKRGEGSKIPLTVYPHEIEILQALHLDAEIELTDFEPPVLEGEFDIEEEFERLQQYYRGNENTPNPTLAAYRRLSEFAALFEGQGSDDEKEELLEQAKTLGIKATKNWGIEKLQNAIDEVLAG